MNIISPLDAKERLSCRLGADDRGSFAGTPDEVLTTCCELFGLSPFLGTEGESLLFEWSLPALNDPSIPRVYTLSIHLQFSVVRLPNGLECPEPEPCWSLGAWLKLPADLFDCAAIPNIRCEEVAELKSFCRTVRAHQVFHHFSSVVSHQARAFMVVSSTFDPETLLREGKIVYDRTA